MSDQNTVFSEIPADHFPFTIEIIDAQGVVVWSREIDSPGAIQIPGLAEEHGPVSTLVVFANGDVVYQPAPEV